MTAPRIPQRGAALILVLVALGLAASYLFLRGAGAVGERAQRDRITVSALAQAKEALIGFAASYREAHPSPLGQIDGFLPCPDLDNDGGADTPCGGLNESVLGRLPWKTLGIPPLRDGGGECLWYAVSGHGKDNPQTAVLNWDTTGQIIVREADGASLTGPAAHDQAMAVILAPQGALGNQNRPGAGDGECGGNNTPEAYLEGVALNSAADAASTVVTASAASLDAGTNNDRGIWITPREIFERIKRRNVFKAEGDTLLADMANCLNALPASALPAPSGSKGAAAVAAACSPVSPQKAKFLAHWQDNLLYGKPGTSLTLLGENCNGILLFGGERMGSQIRASATQKDGIANYLEGGNAALFPNSGNYIGASGFDSGNPGADLAKCIRGLPAGAAQYSFSNNFGSFVPAGAGITADSASQTIAIASGGTSNSGGCFWFPTPIPLAGKILRAYYEFRFTHADTRALTGSGTDRGDGFVFQLLRGDRGLPQGVCGNSSDMGAMAVAGPGGVWGNHSIMVETDVRRDSGDADPAANHTAIMANGVLAHSATNGSTSAACNGTAQGCAPSPANTFEESPAPASHRQRLEVATGCNPGCSACTPSAHTSPNTYARIRVWVDCTDCADVASDFPAPPTAQRCVNLSFPDLGLNSSYFGFSGGFRGGTAAQGVEISNFVIRSE